MWWAVWSPLQGDRWCCHWRGGEHSRAAREFLDSLIEMERSFAEKMRIEEEQIGISQSDKRAVLEAIKKRFYGDLHHHMEVFISGRQPEQV